MHPELSPYRLPFHWLQLEQFIFVPEHLVNHSSYFIVNVSFLLDGLTSRYIRGIVTLVSNYTDQPAI
ncbi:hypothetical protein DERF_001575 [Dermatophagoides farinae]|uniref:Uncharacterized protein n=1 Tax=Dermatophagoides farinae TaxID=6954 RepID=A0A922I9R1_DERFA|nr:hypothetical protein DERF_001575 [Dermatophagoides farinae]